MLYNTNLFLEARTTFEKQGVYTKALEGTFAFNQFWQEETRKCKEGVTIGDFNIPGTMYFYMNYCQILMRDPETGRKRKMFPRFTDVDLEFFRNVERARAEGKGLILVKPRRTGFSLKNGALAVHEYNFYRDSSVIISAFEKKYSRITMGFSKEYLNFLANTPWYKPRNPDTEEFVKARHLKKMDGKEMWVGYNSTIEQITFKDNPFASAGKTASLFIFDEAGIFPNIKESYNISEPCWKDGEDMIGTPIIYGTGGDMTGGTYAFSEMYYNPDTYNLLAFENIWDDGRAGTTCGWFFPASRQRFGTYNDKETKKKIPLVDNDGNSNQVYGEKSIMDLRETKANDPIAFRDIVTQFPLKPQEAFLVTHGNSFPTLQLKEQKSLILGNTPKYLDSNLIGELKLNPETGDLDFEYKDNAVPLRKYPIKKDEKKGCIEVFEAPQRNSEDSVFTNRYIAGIDPYDDDTSTTDSVGCMFVFDRLSRKIVCEYSDRPDTAEIFYENCRRILLWYKATALPENNKLGLNTYFESKKSLYLLAETPIQIRNKTEWKPNLNNSFGFRATKETNQWGNQLIISWLKAEAPFTQSIEIRNVHQLYSLGLIEELLQYNPDPKSNFDRISAMRAVLIYDECLYKDLNPSVAPVAKLEDKAWKNYFKQVMATRESSIIDSFNPLDEDDVQIDPDKQFKNMVGFYT